MNLKTVTQYFDEKSQHWDDIIPEVGKVQCILDNVFLEKQSFKDSLSVLDVGCGTGVLFPYLSDRGVSSITGIDISKKMLQKAEQKFDNAIINLICADACEYTYNSFFDIIIVFNSYPHFIFPENLFKNLEKHLNVGGVITVAHSMSREKLNLLHTSVATEVSNILPPAEVLANLMSVYFKIRKIVSDDKIYQIVAQK